MANFTRSLGAQSGVQLNPPQDDSAIIEPFRGDQVLAVMGRFTRGRIDRPFVVTKALFNKRLGRVGMLRANALNEVQVQSYEALNAGASAAVVQRLIASDAVLQDIHVVNDAGAISFSVAADGASVPNSLIKIRHLECFNDGLVVSVHVPEKRDSGAAVANDEITLVLSDSNGVPLYSFSGSLSSTATDDYNNSIYLDDVVENLTDAVQITVTSPDTSIPVNSPAYGYASGAKAWVESPVQNYFSEGATSYDTAALSAARTKLANTDLAYGYIISGGSQSVAVLTQLATLAGHTNVPMRYDVDGSLTPEQAVTFVESLGFSSHPFSHLLHAFWMPVKSNDPAGVNPKNYFGAAGLNVGMSCARNAVKNAFGMSAKQGPIAGVGYPVSRSGLVQTYQFQDKDYELDLLARARINPVIFSTYASGSFCVFYDSLTSHPGNSYLKLISVVDMSTDLDAQVVRGVKELLQRPMSTTIKDGSEYLQGLFERARDSGWLVASDEPEMNGQAFVFSITPSAASPSDSVDVAYRLRFEGATRQAELTQTVSR